MPTDRPEPPYPAEIRAKGFTLPFDWERVEQSTSWVKCPANMRPWLVLLWLRSWTNVPAGTYPDDDEEIAARIGMPEREFAAHRDILMRGWQLHSDGRWYHRFIVTLVLQMTESRAKDRKRVSEWRAKKQALAANVMRNQRVTNVLVTREYDTGTGTGTGTGSLSSVVASESNHTLSDSQTPESDVAPSTEDKAKGPKPGITDLAKQVLIFLNEHTGHFYRPEPATLKPIVARLKDGYTLRECRAVVVRKAREWGADDKMKKFLRPATLFGAEKFAQYVGEVPPTAAAGQGDLDV